MTRQEQIAKAWADREAARMQRAIQESILPAHGRDPMTGLCRCGYGAGKSYRSLSAHVGQANRRAR